MALCFNLIYREFDQRTLKFERLNLVCLQIYSRYSVHNLLRPNNLFCGHLFCSASNQEIFFKDLDIDLATIIVDIQHVIFRVKLFGDCYIILTILKLWVHKKDFY